MSVVRNVTISACNQDQVMALSQRCGWFGSTVGPYFCSRGSMGIVNGSINAVCPDTFLHDNGGSTATIDSYTQKHVYHNSVR